MKDLKSLLTEGALNGRLDSLIKLLEAEDEATPIEPDKKIDKLEGGTSLDNTDSFPDSEHTETPDIAEKEIPVNEELEKGAPESTENRDAKTTEPTIDTADVFPADEHKETEDIAVTPEDNACKPLDAKTLSIAENVKNGTAVKSGPEIINQYNKAKAAKDNAETNAAAEARRNAMLKNKTAALKENSDIVNIVHQLKGLTESQISRLFEELENGAPESTEVRDAKTTEPIINTADIFPADEHKEAEKLTVIPEDNASRSLADKKYHTSDVAARLTEEETNELNVEPAVGAPSENPGDFNSKVAPEVIIASPVSEPVTPTLDAVSATIATPEDAIGKINESFLNMFKLLKEENFVPESTENRDAKTTEPAIGTADVFPADEHKETEDLAVTPEDDASKALENKDYNICEIAQNLLFEEMEFGAPESTEDRDAKTTEPSIGTTDVYPSDEHKETEDLEVTPEDDASRALAAEDLECMQEECFLLALGEQYIQMTNEEFGHIVDKASDNELSVIEESINYTEFVSSILSDSTLSEAVNPSKSSLRQLYRLKKKQVKTDHKANKNDGDDNYNASMQTSYGKLVDEKAKAKSIAKIGYKAEKEKRRADVKNLKKKIASGDIEGAIDAHKSLKSKASLRRSYLENRRAKAQEATRAFKKEADAAAERRLTAKTISKDTKKENLAKEKEKFIAKKEAASTPAPRAPIMKTAAVNASDTSFERMGAMLAEGGIEITVGNISKLFRALNEMEEIPAAENNEARDAQTTEPTIDTADVFPADEHKETEDLEVTPEDDASKALDASCMAMEESAMYSSLKEAFMLDENYFITESYLTMKPSEKVAKLQNQTAMLICKESNDILFNELIKSAAYVTKLQEEISTKYSPLAKQRTQQLIEHKTKDVKNEYNELYQINEEKGAFKLKFIKFGVNFMTEKQLDKILLKIYTGLKTAKYKKAEMYNPATMDKKQKKITIKTALNNLSPADMAKYKKADDSIAEKINKLKTEQKPVNEFFVEGGLAMTGFILAMFSIFMAGGLAQRIVSTLTSRDY